VSDDGVEFKGTSKRKDRDYMADNISTPASTPRLDEAIEFILENVPDEGIEVSELEKTAKAAGIAADTLKNARAQLKKDKRILLKSIGFAPKKWMLYTTHETEHTVRQKDSK
jgi:lambda repressor-like predicted transcriptional regulator